MPPEGQRNQEHRSDLTFLFLLKLACCGIPLLLILATGGLGVAGGFLKSYGGIVLIGVALAAGGYWLWHRKRQKGCCPRDKNG